VTLVRSAVYKSSYLLTYLPTYLLTYSRVGNAACWILVNSFQSDGNLGIQRRSTNVIDYTKRAVVPSGASCTWAAACSDHVLSCLKLAARSVDHVSGEQCCVELQHESATPLAHCHARVLGKLPTGCQFSPPLPIKYEISTATVAGASDFRGKRIGLR